MQASRFQQLSARQADNQSTPTFRIGCLPVEIIELIFWFSVVENNRNVAHWNNGPTLLCLVCQRWKEVALRCPTLWSTISLTKRQCQPLPYLRAWLDRSKECPLTFGIYIDSDDYFTNRQFPDIDPAFAFLLIETKRWKEVDLQLVELPNVERLGNFSAPILVRFNITSDHANNATHPLPSYLTKLLAEAPNLQDLTWRLPNTPSSSLVNNIASTRLTDIRIDCDLAVDDCISLLSQSTLLRTCHLEGINRSINYQGQLVAAFIKPLTSLLNLRLTGEADLIPILSPITAPILDSLTIAAVIPFESPSPAELTSFIHRSNSSLRHLTLDNLQLPLDQLVQCLRLSPRLETLEIFDATEQGSASQLNDDFILSLGQGQGQDGHHICPLLTRIRFSGSVTSTDGTFSAMVKGRSSGATLRVASLKSVHVEFGASPHGHPRDLDELADLRTQGLLSRVFVANR